MDEDAEFRDIIIQNLEEKGILQKMRSQLRAHIYHLIDEDQDTDNKSNPSQAISGQSHSNDQSASGVLDSELKQLATSVDETIAISLVQDLLDCLNLSYTSSMLKSEMKKRINPWSRRKITDVLQLELDEFETNASNSSTRQADYSADTFNENSSGSMNGTDNGNSMSSDVKAEELEKSSSQAGLSAGAKTPLLVEILRRLPKSTDSLSESGKSSANETAGEFNNETFVAANKTSDSF